MQATSKRQSREVTPGQRPATESIQQKASTAGLQQDRCKHRVTTSEAGSHAFHRIYNTVALLGPHAAGIK